MRVLMISLLLQLLPAAALPAAPPPTMPELAAKVLAATGITSALDQLPAQFLEGARASAAASGDSAAAAVVERLCTQVFDSAHLEATASERLASGATREQLIAMLEWAESPLASKMTALEREANGLEARQTLLAFAQGLAFVPPEAHRLAQIKRLAQASGGTELLVRANSRIFRAMMEGMATVAPELRVDPPDSLDALIATLERDIRTPLTESFLVSLLFTYRNCSDPELERYIDELARPPASELTPLATEAMIRALELACYELGRETAKLRPSPQR